MFVNKVVYPDRGFRWKAADGRVFRYLLYLISALFFIAYTTSLFAPEVKGVAQNISVGAFLVGAALIICSRNGMSWTKSETNDADHTWDQATVQFWGHKGLMQLPKGEQLYMDCRVVSAHDPYEEHFQFSNGMVGLYYEAYTFSEDATKEKKVHCWLAKCLVLQFKDGTEVLRVATRQGGQLDIARAASFPPGALISVLSTHCVPTLRRMMPARAIDKFIGTVPLGILESGESLPDGDIGVPGSEIQVLSPA
jgi:hypothetical protein